MGVDNATVHRDLGRVANVTPAVWHETGDEIPVTTISMADVPPARPVVGLDGKTYKRPEPSEA